MALKLQNRREDSDRLNKVADKSTELLFETRAVFPFDFVPDIIQLDRNQMTIIHRDLFRLRKMESIQIKDILNSEMTSGPFLASLKINSKFFSDQYVIIKFLKTKDALKLRNLIQGLTIAYTEKINIEDIPKEELVEKLIQLGSNAR